MRRAAAPRAALAAASTFLGANGHDLSLGLEWVSVMERVASGKCTRDELAALLGREIGADVDVEPD